MKNGIYLLKQEFTKVESRLRHLIVGFTNIHHKLKNYTQREVKNFDPTLSSVTIEKTLGSITPLLAL